MLNEVLGLAAIALARPVAAFIVLPLGAGARVRGFLTISILVAIGLAVACASVALPAASQAMASHALPSILVRELVIGTGIGLTGAIALSIGRLAGGLIDAQLPGWRSSQDTLSGRSGGLVAGYLQLVTVVLFLLLGGHTELLIGVIGSYGVAPIDGASAASALGSMRAGLTLAASVFAVAMIAVLPIVVLVALVEVAVGLALRLAGWSEEPGLTSIRAVVALAMILVGLRALLITISEWMLEVVQTPL